MMVFVDESGDFGFTSASSKYIILAALILENQFQLDNILKKMRRYTFKMVLNGVTEIKANQSSPSIKSYMIAKLNQIDPAEIFFAIIEKKEFLPPSTSLTIFKRLLITLYDYLTSMKDVYIIIDKSYSKDAFDREFKPIFIQGGIKENVVEVIQGLSHNWSGLQFADLLVWTCFRKYEHHDDVLFDEISIKKTEHVITRNERST
jgi:hypothetical protein